MFEKILVAIDGSETGNKALKTAIMMAKQLKSKLTLINVGKIIFFPDGMSVDSIDQVYKVMEEVGEELLNKGKLMAEAEGIEAEVHYLEGDPASQIIHMEEEGNYKLIVIGSRGLGAFKEMMLGSVSHRVSQLSHCPVLIVK